jgi:hypothetical protein
MINSRRLKKAIKNEKQISFYLIFGDRVSDFFIPSKVTLRNRLCKGRTDDKLEVVAEGRGRAERTVPDAKENDFGS